MKTSAQMNPNHFGVSEAASLVRLAMDLAQRRGMDDPRPFFPEAARLISEAQDSWAKEIKRRSEEGNLTMEQLTDQIASELRKDCVPFEKLCRPDGDKGKHYETFSYMGANGVEQIFRWLVFNSERGFKDCVRLYASVHNKPENVNQAFKNLWADAKAGAFNAVTVRAIGESRRKAKSERASKGGKAKVQKMKGTRASAADSLVK